MYRLMYLQNIGKHPTDYKASHPGRQVIFVVTAVRIKNPTEL
jgi:hypothetical protein